MIKTIYTIDREHPSPDKEQPIFVMKAPDGFEYRQTFNLTNGMKELLEHAKVSFNEETTTKSVSEYFDLEGIRSYRCGEVTKPEIPKGKEQKIAPGQPKYYFTGVSIRENAVVYHMLKKKLTEDGYFPGHVGCMEETDCFGKQLKQIHLIEPGL